MKNKLTPKDIPLIVVLIFIILYFWKVFSSGGYVNFLGNFTGKQIHLLFPMPATLGGILLYVLVLIRIVRPINKSFFVQAIGISCIFIIASITDCNLCNRALLGTNAEFQKNAMEGRYDPTSYWGSNAISFHPQKHYDKCTVYFTDCGFAISGENNNKIVDIYGIETGPSDCIFLNKRFVHGEFPDRFKKFNDFRSQLTPAEKQTISNLLECLEFETRNKFKYESSFPELYLVYDLLCQPFWDPA